MFLLLSIITEIFHMAYVKSNFHHKLFTTQVYRPAGVVISAFDFSGKTMDYMFFPPKNSSFFVKGLC